MRDVIFEATTASLSRITPIVFGDELFQTRLLRIYWNAYGLRREPAPLVANLPLVLGRLAQPLRPNAVPHRKIYVVLTVDEASGGRNCASGHDLGNENNSSAVIAPLFATNVEAEVYLLEIGMKRNWETPKELGVGELEAHKAEVGSSLE